MLFLQLKTSKSQNMHFICFPSYLLSYLPNLIACTVQPPFPLLFVVVYAWYFFTIMHKIDPWRNPKVVWWCASEICWLLSLNKLIVACSKQKVVVHYALLFQQYLALIHPQEQSNSDAEKMFILMFHIIQQKLNVGDSSEKK